MSLQEENRIKLHLGKVSNDQQQNVVSFRSYSECSEDELQESYKAIVGKILSGRDVIIVTKGAQLIDLISDSVDAADQNYVKENAIIVATFTLKPASYETNATLLKQVPLSIAEDLATSSEFVYGNLWFLIPSSDANLNECSEQVINDIRMLTPSAFTELPVLWHEAVALSAMYDGLEILWFKPDNYVYENVIKPLFEN